MEALTGIDVKARKELIERVAASALLSRSTRLKDLLLYLCTRVLDEGAQEIHELEVGHRVFGRDAQYDTIADNIVRVHASMLRKRLNEYFEHEGRDEPIVIEIPKGNYAPQFVERPHGRRRIFPAVAETFALAPAVGPDPLFIPSAPPPKAPPAQRPAWQFRIAVVLAVIFCGLSIYLFWIRRAPAPAAITGIGGQPEVRQFWSGIFPQSGSATVVLDDTSLDFYQQATGRPVSLAEYFDRSYLNDVEKNAAASHLDPALVYSQMLKRQSSFSYTTTIWKMAQLAVALHGAASVQFARDLTFRQVKSGNVVLLGDPQSNPWMQPFEPRLSIDWVYDATMQVYYPRDKNASASAQGQFRPVDEEKSPRAGYATISYLPNLSGSGNALLLTATGGSAMGVAVDFLSDEASMKALRARLPKDGNGFPHFEALLRTAPGSKELNSVQILICRPVTSSAH